MVKLKILIQMVSIAVFLLVAGHASADISGMLKMCAGCHGEDGRGGDSGTPIIAGIPAVVQEDALYAYMDGDRTCGSTPMMCKTASSLTEDQIVELAEHFAAMSYVAAGEEFDAALADVGKAIHDKNCALCHGADGPDDADSSILHGQRKDYLRYALQQYAAGERTQLPAMEKKTSVLSSDDVEALVNYYASYRD
jgi:sulfide dehydrogenase cytochrome subunit